MKKRFFGTLLAALLIVSQAVTVFAAESKTGEMALAGDSVGYYELRLIDGEDDMSDVADEAVRDKILAVNAGEQTLQSIADLAPELASLLDGKVMLTKFYDIVAINGGVRLDNGKYKVTLSVSALTKAVSDVGLLCYNSESKAWEIIDLTDVDYDNKEITVELDALSLFAVIGKVNGDAADSTVGTSPKTGAVSGWMAWLGAAVVLVAAGAVTYRRSRH